MIGGRSGERKVEIGNISGSYRMNHENPKHSVRIPTDSSILVLGCEGMLGHKMFQILSNRNPKIRGTILGTIEDPFYRAIPLFRADQIIEHVDFMDIPALREMLEKEKPKIVVNCVGIVKQREESKMAIPSIAINSLLPHMLADWVRGWGGRLIHFSTDCVFSGKKGNYREDDASDAEDLYGKSKYLGEVVAPNAITFRTSIIGRELANFKSLLEWFLAQKGRRVKGFRRVYYSGVTTNYMAEVVYRLIQEHPNLSGLYQVTAPPISKYSLLCRLREAYHLDIEIIPDDNAVSDRSMNGTRFREATGYPEPDWDGLIQQLVGDDTPYHEWRLPTVPGKAPEAGNEFS